MRFVPVAMVLLAVVVAFASLTGLLGAEDDLLVEPLDVGSVPAMVVRSEHTVSAPIVVIAHGFSGSSGVMMPIAGTLARAGYLAVVFDFPGHGRHPWPISRSLATPDGARVELVETVERVMDAALALPGADGRTALIGHSVGADVVVRTALGRADVAAVVGISMYSTAVTASAPRNLLAIAGGWEPDVLTSEALRVEGLATNPGAGGPDTAAGPAKGIDRRRAVIVDGVEHLSVLYADQTQRAIVNWLDSVLAPGSAAVRGAASVSASSPAMDAALKTDGRGTWLALWVAAVLVLAGPAMRFLPRAAGNTSGTGVRPPGWRRLWPTIVVPPVLTPLVLAPCNARVTGLVLVDDLGAHLSLQVVLTAVVMQLTGCLPRVTEGISWSRVVLCAVACATFGMLCLVWPLHLWFTSLSLTALRIETLLLWWLPATLLWVVVAGVTGGADGARLARFAAGLLFLLSLAASAALAPESRGIVVFLLPPFAAAMLASGWLARCCEHASGSAPAGAAGGAFVACWLAVAVTPLILQ